MSQPLMDDVTDDHEFRPEGDDVDVEQTESPAPEASDDASSADADTGDADAPGQPTTPETPVPGTPGTPAPSSAPAPSPFVVKAHGKALALDGVTRIPGEGLRVPEAAMSRVQQLLSRGLEMETTGRTRIRELELHTQDLQQQQSQAEVQATAILEWLEEATASEDAMVEALTKYASLKPMLAARMERALVNHDRRQWDRQRRAGEPTPQEQQAQLQQSLKDVGHEVLQELAPTHGLTEKDTQAIAARLLRRPETYLTRIQTPDGPTMAFDDDAFKADVAEEAALRVQSRTAVTKTQQAADQNAKTRAGTIPAVVKAPAQPVTPTPPRDRDSGRFKSKEEWEAAMGMR